MVSHLFKGYRETVAGQPGACTRQPYESVRNCPWTLIFVHPYGIPFFAPVRNFEIQ